MKGSVLLSLTLDILAVAFIFLPARYLAGLSTDPKVVRNIKRVVGILLLLSGFLVDRYITHGG
jgi:threonine/homoserine/homoserine lactone efflux protein